MANFRVCAYSSKCITHGVCIPRLAWTAPRDISPHATSPIEKTLLKSGGKSLAFPLVSDIELLHAKFTTNRLKAACTTLTIHQCRIPSVENLMENQMNNNLLPLPRGFTFNPTDEGIMRYLRAKVENIQLPFLDPILEFDVYAIEHPSQLFNPGLNGTHLFFYVKKSGRDRTAGNGYWNASNGPIDVFNREGELIGQRRSLAYYNSKKRKSSAAKTKWIMNECRLPDPHPMMSGSSSKAPMWTLCKIGETGRTFGSNNYQRNSTVPLQQQQPQQQQLKRRLVPHQVDHQQQQQHQQLQMELVPHQVDHQQQQQHDQQSECDDDDRLVLTKEDLPPEFWVNYDHDSSSKVVDQEASAGRIGSGLHLDLEVGVLKPTTCAPNMIFHNTYLGCEVLSGPVTGLRRHLVVCESHEHRVSPVGHHVEISNSIETLDVLVILTTINVSFCESRNRFGRVAFLVNS
ncbi:hypothetical protein Sjap_011487 [Stephania japonica]|uniref:NAC domain-containing protein n=1 Tax=Stephania japonica TaxID=461633 RepID=A0AAP0JCH3_9MAGN